MSAHRVAPSTDNARCIDTYEKVCSHYDHDVPKIDPTGPVPPYPQVAEIIRNQIRSGKLAKGSRITEAEITEAYEVARSTARRTLAVLRDEGLIYTVPQRGSYVH
jgi:GntR family transcriptional regulator